MEEDKFPEFDDNEVFEPKKSKQVDSNVFEPTNATSNNSTNIKSESEIIGTKPGQNVMRVLVMIFLQIANIAFTVFMGYLLVLLIMAVAGSNINNLFSADFIDLGFLDALGVFAWLGIILLAAFMISIIVGFIRANLMYYNLLKFAKNQKMDVVLSPKRTFGSIIWMIIIVLALAFVSLGFIQNNVVSILSISLYISTIAIFISLILTIIHSIINRIKYLNLTEEEKLDVKEKCKQFNTKLDKKERKVKVGKLY